MSAFQSKLGADRTPHYKTVELLVDGVSLEIALVEKGGNTFNQAPIVFLHGFGSTKEDFLDIIHHPSLGNFPIIAYDAPGCGQSRCSNLDKVNIPFLVDTAAAILREMMIDKFHVIGHSMGGLTALLLAHRYPERVLSFVDIEGNVAPEDCFLSRQIVQHAHTLDSAEPNVFFEAFIERTRKTLLRSNALYAINLPYKVRAGVVLGIFRSMVDLSDTGDLMARFLGLPCPRMYMFGHDNDGLSYLPNLRAQGIVLADIPECGHFPMYSNPTHMWHHIDQFYKTFI